MELVSDWNRIEGHHALKERLQHLANTQRVPQGVLLSGPPGVGKALIIRTLAKALLCHRNPAETPLPCGACPACLKFENASHQDFLFLFPKPNTIPVDDVREVLGKLAYSSVESSRRAVVVLEADLMKPESMSALLKVMEEPPPGTHFLLTTSNPGGLLATIHSRLTPFEAGYLSLPDALAAAQAQGVEISETTALIYEAVGRQVGRLKTALAQPQAAEVTASLAPLVNQWLKANTLTAALGVFAEMKKQHAAWGAFLAEATQEDDAAAEEEKDKDARAPARLRQEALRGFLSLVERTALGAGANPFYLELIAAMRDDARQPLRDEICLLALSLSVLQPQAAARLFSQHRVFSGE